MSDLEGIFSAVVRNKFELHSYRNAGSILSCSFPDQFQQITDALEAFEITEQIDLLQKSGKPLLTVS